MHTRVILRRLECFHFLFLSLSPQNTPCSSPPLSLADSLSLLSFNTSLSLSFPSLLLTSPPRSENYPFHTLQSQSSLHLVCTVRYSMLSQAVLLLAFGSYLLCERCQVFYYQLCQSSNRNKYLFLEKCNLTC